MKKTKIQNEFAGKVGLNETSNLSMEYTGRTGEPMVQSFAGMAPQSDVPVPTWPIEPNTLGAVRQSFGGQAPTTTRPSKSFGEDPGNNIAKYSDRSVKQSY